MADELDIGAYYLNCNNSAANCSTALKFGVWVQGCGVIESVDWCIMDLIIIAQNDWHDVGQPRSSQLAPFLVHHYVLLKLSNSGSLIIFVLIKIMK